MRFSLACMDAIEYMRSLPNESVDLVLTDPAYESLEEHRARGTTTRLTGQWFPIFPNDRFHDWFVQVHRVLKWDRHAYVFCDAKTAFRIAPMGACAGLRFWKPIVWDKVTMGMGYHYRCRYEFVLFFEKGKRRLANLGVPDVLTYPRVRGGYPTEKPVDLAALLVGQSASRGDVVLDTFCGSGALLAGAVSVGCDARGCDVLDSAIDITRARLIAAGATEQRMGLLA